MKKVPELRFKEFSGEWEERQLNKIIEISNKKFNPKINLTNQICIELEHISSKTGKLLGYIDSNNQESIKNIFMENQIIYGKLRPYLRKYWFTKFNGVCSSEFWVFNGKQIDNKYLYFFVQTEKFNQISNISCGSKMPRADWNYMSLFKFYIPDAYEQKKIALFLSSIDKKLELTDKKLEFLEKYKKGLIQKLLTGKIRFPGFNDEWKNIKLYKILKERKTYIDNNKNLEHLSLTIDGILPKSKRYDRDFLVKDSNKKYKITYRNDICYNPANLKFGVICKNNYGEGIFSPIYVTFEVNNEFDPNFINYYITAKNFINKALRYQEGTIYERMAVNPNDLLLINIKTPSLQEQQKIASFLSAIDKKIELIKFRLENLKRYKKGLLQKMFV